jgi:hypothetical protein
MSQNIRLKRSAVPGRIPSVDQLQLGEVALNTYDGKLYLKQNVDGAEQVINVGETASLADTASFALDALFATSAGSADTASYSDFAVTASYVRNAISASFSSTASYVLSTGTSTSSSFAATASSADNFTVRGTLTAQTIVAQTITSSTEFITGSTRFGSQLSNTHQFTGSVSVTGSLSVGGNLIATSFSGSGANLTGIDTIEKVFYVAEDGSDTNDGKSLSFPFRTIKAATIAASASRAANPGLPVYRQSIQVKSGYYSEEAPITVPSNVSILGDDLRSVVVAPTTATSGSNLFLMNNGTYCWGLRLEGCKIDNLEDPRNGFFFAYKYTIGHEGVYLLKNNFSLLNNDIIRFLKK